MISPCSSSLRWPLADQHLGKTIFSQLLFNINIHMINTQIIINMFQWGSAISSWCFPTAETVLIEVLHLFRSLVSASSCALPVALLFFTGPGNCVLQCRSASGLPPCSSCSLFPISKPLYEQMSDVHVGFTSLYCALQNVSFSF